MNIDYYANNCSMVAIHKVVPDRDQVEVIAACMKAGFTEWLGMMPHQIEQALKSLGIKYTEADLLRYKPTIKDNDVRTSMTLNQALAATSTETCLIRLTGHIIASHKGIPLDTNMRRRGARRRVLGIYVIHNATLTIERSSAISRDPEIQFVHDITHDTRSNKSIYEAVYKYLGDPALPVRFSELKSLGYTRRMLRRHLQRGDVIITQS